jgi:predicted O-methyltransferase YrrM
VDDGNGGGAAVEELVTAKIGPGSETPVQALLARLLSQGDVDWIEELRRISMLSAETLFLLRVCAFASEGAIVEIGPFVGGSTCAMAAVVAPERRFVSVECGGASPHPTHGSDDILRDLRTNLASHGFSHRVTLLPGWASDVYHEIPKRIGDQRVGLLFIDADGNVAEHLLYLAPLLSDTCLIVLDDLDDPEKGAGVKLWVDHAIELGGVEQLGVADGGTWFGRVNGDAERLPVHHFRRDRGRGWGIDLEVPVCGDSVEGAADSELVLLEDGRRLGPAHAIHEEVRALGQGRYSHWGDWLLFSSSDGSNPNTNGRTYEVQFGGDRRRIGVGPGLLIAERPPASLRPSETPLDDADAERDPPSAD